MHTICFYHSVTQSSPTSEKIQAFKKIAVPPVCNFHRLTCHLDELKRSIQHRKESKAIYLPIHSQWKFLHGQWSALIGKTAKMHGGGQSGGKRWIATRAVPNVCKVQCSATQGHTVQRSTQSAQLVQARDLGGHRLDSGNLWMALSATSIQPKATTTKQTHELNVGLELGILKNYCTGAGTSLDLLDFSFWIWGALCTVLDAYHEKI